MKSVALTLAGLVLVAAGSAASAQPAADNAELKLAQCMNDRHPSDAQHLLGAATEKEANQAFYNLINESSCARQLNMLEMDPHETSLTMGTLRGIFAEQRLRQYPAAVQALPALSLSQQPYVRPWFVGTARSQFVDQMAACTADTNPGGIFALVNTAPGSAGEADAMQKLSANLNRCLPHGNVLQASTQQIRSALADALYQRVANPALSLASVPKTPR